MKKYRYSEIFGRTIQGEGRYTNIPSVWIRYWGCTLSCDGFGQDDPTDPSTYERPYDLISIKDITKMEDLPVFTKQCDSAYSWNKDFRHLAHLNTAEEIVQRLRDVTKSEFNPDGLFLHPHSGQNIHMCFTGGEPIMSQESMVEVLKVMKSQNNLPNYVTVETNGTVHLKPNLSSFIQKNYAPSVSAPEGEIWQEREWFWSVSPKLFNTSGELAEQAIHPEIIKEYQDISPNGQLKFVVNGTDASWNELEEVLYRFRTAGITWPVYIMPSGATKEDQERHQARICEQAFDRGYNFSARVHCWVFGNVVGK